MKKAFLATIPIMAGYIILGIGFGIILETKGYGILWSLAMGLFIYAGSMQYVAIDLITGGVSLITAALTTLMVNARHLFYGISMVDRYKHAGRKKPYMIFALTDETYSLVCSSSDKDKEQNSKYCFRVSLFNQIYWVTGCCLGSLIGSVMSFNTEGIDFALTALFVSVMTEQWLSTKNHSYAVIGTAASVICLAIFGAENFLIPAMIAITAVLTAVGKIKGEIFNG